MSGRLGVAAPLTALAMLAFAANSLLCRAALAHPTIDPASFTAIRLVAGAVVLGMIVLAQQKSPLAAGSWKEAAALFAYAAAFSFAYVSLTASTGALILFGLVQATMIVAGFVRGERLKPLQIAGALTAVAGLIYLLAPGLHAPSPLGAGLMAIAGVAWGFYSLMGRGRAGRDPTSATAGNFLRAAPMGLALLAPFAMHLHASWQGVALAAASGAIASGMGYAIWYAALKHLAASEAAIVQLTVPAIAGLGGVALLSESFSPRLVFAGAAILGGACLVIIAGARREQTPPPRH